MRIRVCSIYLLFLLFLFASLFAFAQQPDATHETPDAVNTDSARARDGGAAVPHFMRFSGVIRDDAGTPRTGVVGLTFALYDQNDGGAAIWQETQNVTLDDAGRYNVLLGATKLRGLPMEPFASGEARFIGARVVEENAVEQPRVRLVSVPYALAAGDAQSLGGRPVTDFALTKAAALASGVASQAAPGTDPMVTSGTAGFIGKFTNTTDLGNSIMFDTGANIGIGTSTPTDTLQVVGGIRFGAGTFVAGQAKLFTSAQHGTLLTANTGSSNDIALVSASGNLLLTNPTGTNNLVMLSGGGFGVNTSVITEKLTVNGGIQFGPSSFSAGAPTLYKDSAHGSVLTASQGSSNDLALVSRVGNLLLTNPTGTNNLVFFSGGNFGLNTFTPSSLLDVNGQIRAAAGLKFGDNSTQTTAATLTGVTAGSGLTGGGTSGTVGLAVDTNVVQSRITGTCAAGQYVRVVAANGTVTCGTDQTGGGGITIPAAFSGSSASGAFTVTQTNSVVLANDPTFAFAQTGIPAAIVGIGSATSNTGVGVAGFSNSPNSPAIVGWNGFTGAIGTGDAQGVIGQSDTPGGTGVEGNSKAATGAGIGVRGQADSATGVGVYGQNSIQGGLAGKFDGNVQVNGSLQTGTINNQGGGQVQVSGGLNVNSGGVTITGNSSITGTLTVSGTVNKNGGNFRIDHPLDPGNKYLYHSFVESPDMMNIYNGVVVLDAKGQAWITMPDWFEALNMDFRYQLTPIGDPGRHITYVANEIKGNRFKISGGKAFGKISWQVTGIRHDAWADANRTIVEVEKPAKEQGTYVFPEGFQKPIVAKK